MAGFLSVAVIGLLLALVSGAFGRGPDASSGAESAAATVAGTPPNEVVSGGTSEGVALSKALEPAAPEAKAGFAAAATSGSHPESKVTPTLAEADTDSGTGQGIKVHGHWTIEIREPDGSTVSRHEFDNALEDETPRELARILGRLRSVGRWSITIDDSDGIAVGNDRPCVTDLGNPTRCLIHEASENPGMSSVFWNMTLEVPSSGANQDQLVLRGSAIAGRDGTVSRVETRMAICLGSVASADCTVLVFPGAVTVAFSSRNIANVAVQTGQEILVIVAFSFS